MPSLFWAKPVYIDPPMPKRKIKKWVDGFWYDKNVIWSRGDDAEMKLFNSPEEAKRSCTNIAFIAGVEIDEEDC